MRKSEVVSKDSSLEKGLNSVRERLLQSLPENPLLSDQDLKEIAGMVSFLAESLAAASQDIHTSKETQQVKGSSGNINGGFLTSPVYEPEDYVPESPTPRQYYEPEDCESVNYDESVGYEPQDYEDYSVDYEPKDYESGEDSCGSNYVTTKRKEFDDAEESAVKVKRPRTHELDDSAIFIDVSRVMAKEWVMSGTAGWLED